MLCRMSASICENPPGAPRLSGNPGNKDTGLPKLKHKAQAGLENFLISFEKLPR